MSFGSSAAESYSLIRRTSSYTQNYNAFWILVFLLFFAIYLLTLSENVSVAHDSPGYASHILSMDPAYYPNHLFYELILSSYVRVLRQFGLSPSLASIEIPGAFAGAATLVAALLTLVRRLNVPPSIAAAAIACAGFSFGIWYYSVGIEIYIYSLCCMAWSFFIISGKKKTLTSIIAASFLQSMAILFHQTSILFSMVPVFALLGASDLSLPRRFGLLLTYVLVGTVLVCGSYLAVAAASDHLTSVETFWHWFIGYGSQSKYWSPLSPKTLLLIGVGFGRAVIGGHFVFGVPALQGRLQALFPGNRLDDEIFLVRDYVGSIAEGLLALSLLWAILALVAAALALAGGVRLLRQGRGGSLVLILAWLVPYTLFFSAWDASNVDFWVPQVLLTWMLLAVGLAARYATSHSVKLLVALAGGLAILNGVGSIAPARNPANDFHHSRVVALTQAMDPRGLIILGDFWPDSLHLRFLSHTLDVTALTTLYKQGKGDPTQTESAMGSFAAAVRSMLAAGRPVYLWPDVLTIRPETLANYGPSYENFVKAFRSRICGTTALSSKLAPTAYGLQCIR